MAYADPEAGIRFVTEVLGFEEQVLVRDPSGRIAHSEYSWPEGGIVQQAPDDPGNPFLTEHGRNSRLQVITRDTLAVWEGGTGAGVEGVRTPRGPDCRQGGRGL